MPVEILSRGITFSDILKDWICWNSRSVECTMYPLILFYVHDLFPLLLNLCTSIHAFVYIHTHSQLIDSFLQILCHLPQVFVFSWNKDFLLCCHIIIMTPKTIFINSTNFKLSCFVFKMPSSATWVFLNPVQTKTYSLHGLNWLLILSQSVFSPTLFIMVFSLWYFRSIVL